MILRQIALLSATERVNFQELTRVSAAIQKQVARDFGPIWGVIATVDPFQSKDDVPTGYWPVTVVDTIPVQDAEGYHHDENGQPSANVLWFDQWSLTASHETLEMLADPFGSQTAQGPSVQDPSRRVAYLVEICDPCESAACAYTINTGQANQEVLVSDFCTPHYFDPVKATGVRYSFSGKITAPRQVLDGGYLSWQTQEGEIWQLFGPAEMGFFQHRGPGRLNRERTDRLTRGLRSSRASLTAAAATDNCTLTRDPLTGDLSGATGATANLSISGATFLDVNYAGTSVAGPGTTAQLTLLQGRKALFATLDGVTGASVQLTDSDCGSILDAFTFDSGNPIWNKIIVGN